MADHRRRVRHDRALRRPSARRGRWPAAGRARRGRRGWPVVISTRFGTSASACAVARNSSGVADLRAEGDVDQRLVDALARLGCRKRSTSESPSSSERGAHVSTSAPKRCGPSSLERRAGERAQGPVGVGRGDQVRPDVDQPARRSARPRRTRRTRSSRGRSGPGAIVLRRARASAAAPRARRGRRTAPGSRARRRGRRWRTPAPRPRRGPSGSPRAWKAKPGALDHPPRRGRSGHQDLVPGAPPRGRTARAGRSARRPDRSRRECACAFQTSAARSYSP